VARDVGISDSTLSKWVKKFSEKMIAANTFPGKGKLAPYDKERFDLKREN
jgi:transposase